MSQSPSARTEVLRKRYKVAIDADEGRHRREENQVEIRKSKREESLLKKRHEGLQAEQFPSPADVHASNTQKKIFSADEVMDGFEKTLVETETKLKELEDKFGSRHESADTATKAVAANISTVMQGSLEAQANAVILSGAVSSYQALTGELATLRDVVEKLQTDFQGLKDLSKTRLIAAPVLEDFPKVFAFGEGSSQPKFIPKNPSPSAAKLKFVDMKKGVSSPSLSPKSNFSESPSSPSTFETKEQFLAWYNEQMKVVFETRPSDVCFPDHKGRCPRFIFLPGAEPALVKQIFDIGALDLMYFTNTFEEVSLFPEEVKKALGAYARIAPEARDPRTVMFLKVYSAAPTYDEEERIPALHVLKVGVYRGENHVVDTNQTYKEYRYYNMDSIGLRRGRDLRVLFKTLENILTRNGQRILAYSGHHIVVAMALEFRPGDRKKIELFRDKIFGNKIKRLADTRKNGFARNSNISRTHAPYAQRLGGRWPLRR